MPPYIAYAVNISGDLYNNVPTPRRPAARGHHRLFTSIASTNKSCPPSIGVVRVALSCPHCQNRAGVPTIMWPTLHTRFSHGGPKMEGDRDPPFSPSFSFRLGGDKRCPCSAQLQKPRACRTSRASEPTVVLSYLSGSVREAPRESIRPVCMFVQANHCLKRGGGSLRHVHNIAHPFFFIYLFPNNKKKEGKISLLCRRRREQTKKPAADDTKKKKKS